MRPAALNLLEIRLVLEALLERVAAGTLAGPVAWTRSNNYTDIPHMPIALHR